MKPTQPATLPDKPTPFAQKRFGQNFLVDRRIIQRIIDVVEPKPGETIVEIGPGRGALTGPLLELGARVIAIEFDRNLVPVLKEKFANATNFCLVHDDALIANICTAIQPVRTARLVANLPYNIATAVLQRLIEQRECLTQLVLMLQREVVDRIVAPTGSKERGYLSVFVQAYCETEKLFDVAPTSFRPAPKVWSSIVKISFRRALPFGDGQEELFWQVVSAGFAQRRKTILNNLRNAGGPLLERMKAHGGASIVLCRAEVAVDRRAETLSLEEWAKITRALA
ncbi:MAG TPA: 16S rRNA (adenine(1518)-N(6)/adenine(1519)-N(6))-dimethyltransferase RsmA [Pyrinomonadaceae bacterium]|nr:16S rRNA (adenine(1518)-N(6)/adenine(1519)-N(6))-dimethyltransferase RsmA [Pyrinomonadaceae bacterium]